MQFVRIISCPSLTNCQCFECREDKFKKFNKLNFLLGSVPYPLCNWLSTVLILKHTIQKMNIKFTHAHISHKTHRAVFKISVWFCKQEIIHLACHRLTILFQKCLESDLTALQRVLSPPGLPLTQILIHGNSIMFMCLGEQTITEFENGLAGPWLGMDGRRRGCFFGIDNQTGNTKCVQSQPHHVPHLIMSNNCIIIHWG